MKRIATLFVAGAFALSACTSADPYTGEQGVNNTTIGDRKSTRLNYSHSQQARMTSSA